MSEERKKILVLDDDGLIIKQFNRYGKGHVEAIAVIRHDFEEQFSGDKSVEFLLRNTPYLAIALDGEMYLNQGGIDGNVIAQRLRSGHYGETNRETLLINISGSYDNPMTDVWLNKRDLARKEDIEDVVDKIMELYVGKGNER